MREWARPVLDENLLVFAYHHHGLTPEEVDERLAEGYMFSSGHPNAIPWMAHTYGDVVYKLTGYTVLLEPRTIWLLQRREPPYLWARVQGMSQETYERLRSLEPAMVRGYGHVYYWLRDVVSVLPKDVLCSICGRRSRDWEQVPWWEEYEDRYYYGLIDQIPKKHKREGYRVPKQRCCSRDCAIVYLKKTIHLRREQEWMTTEGKRLLRQVKKRAREHHRGASKSRSKVSPRQKTSAT